MATLNVLIKGAIAVGYGMLIGIIYSSEEERIKVACWIMQLSALAYVNYCLYYLLIVPAN